MEQERGFFPIFLDIRNKNILFVGGGRIASRRAAVLNQFAARMRVAAPEITDELRTLAEAGRVEWIAKPFAESMLEDADIVLACTDNAELNHGIAAACRQRGILVNNCSDHTECDFYFPGVAVREEVVVAVNAGGRAHKTAAKLRARIAELLQEEDEYET